MIRGATEHAPMRGVRATICALVLGASAGAAAGQEPFRVLHGTVEIERRLSRESFQIIDWRGSRAAGDRTARVVMSFADDTMVIAKWAIAPVNGSAFNNEPRYEVAAYELQKLFLGEDEYVVPPTLLRAFPIDLLRDRAPDVKPTFAAAPGTVIVALQYWLVGVRPDGFWDPRRALNDTVYARHIGNLNVLTYLIRHGDDNVGNFLISTTNAEDPRVFAVDNGVAFASQPSNRGHSWRDIRVSRLPRATVERLRGITAQDLQALAVLAEYELHNGIAVPVDAGTNMAPGRGVRVSGDRIQFGLAAHEIRGVETRLRQLLRQIDAGRIRVF
jgi:hypothetical protein